jgi:hypothetical protein
VMEKRKQRRQAVELPIEILAVDGVDVDWMATTRNISSGGGVCFTCPHDLEIGQAVRYGITLSEGAAPVRILCSGRVVRCIPERGEVPIYDIAVTMARHGFMRPSAQASSGSR